MHISVSCRTILNGQLTGRNSDEMHIRTTLECFHLQNCGSIDADFTSRQDEKPSSITQLNLNLKMENCVSYTIKAHNLLCKG